MEGQASQLEKENTSRKKINSGTAAIMDAVKFASLKLSSGGPSATLRNLMTSETSPPPLPLLRKSNFRDAVESSFSVVSIPLSTVK